MAQRLQEAQLVFGEELARPRRDVQDAARRPVEPQRDAGVGHGRAQALDDVGHARALGRVARLHAVAAPEDLGTEALPEAFRPDLVQVALRHAARRGEVQLPFFVRAHEDPGRLEVRSAPGSRRARCRGWPGPRSRRGRARRPRRGWRAPARAGTRVSRERADAILVGRLHAIAVVPVRHGEVMVAPDYARPSPGSRPRISNTYEAAGSRPAHELRSAAGTAQGMRRPEGVGQRTPHEALPALHQGTEGRGGPAGALADPLDGRSNPGRHRATPANGRLSPPG